MRRSPYFNQYRLTARETESRIQFLKQHSEHINPREFSKILQTCADIHRNIGTSLTLTKKMNRSIASAFKGITCKSQTVENILTQYKKYVGSGDVDADKLRTQRVTELIEAGSCLLLFTMNPNSDTTIKTRVQVVAGQNVQNPSNLTNGLDVNGHKVINGVCYDAFNNEIGFYYWADGKENYVKKYNSYGMLNAYLEVSPEFYSVRTPRSLPMIYGAVKSLANYERNLLATSEHAENAAALGAIVTADNPEGVRASLTNDPLPGEEDMSVEEIAYNRMSGDRLSQVSIAPFGTKIDLISPTGATNYKEIIEISKNAVATDLDLPKAFIFADVESASFSSAKFSGADAVKKVSLWVDWIRETERIIYTRAIQELEILGKVSFFEGEDLSIGFMGEFTIDEIDGLKSAKAETEKRKGLSSTATSYAAKNGVEFTDVLDNIGNEIKEAKEYESKYGLADGTLTNLVLSAYMQIKQDIKIEGAESAD
jgi:hypothetical protein